MGIREENLKEKLAVVYDLAGITADTSQFQRAFLRGESKGKKSNIKQIITKWERVMKRL